MKKNKIKIPLYDIKLSKETIARVTNTLKSGWLSSGPSVKEFESKIARLLNMKYAAGVSSATDGLILSLLAVGIKRGDEVITTPYTFAASTEAILAVGARPVFTDISTDSLNIDPDLIKKKITSCTKAIIPVDIAGYPADYTELRKICREYNLKLIADSAHSIGSSYKKKSVPSWADLSVISFHATKNLICGEGGMVLSNNRKLIEKVKLLSGHGINTLALDRKKNKSWEYDIKFPGYKGNLSELHASVGLGQLVQFKKDQKNRERLANLYLNQLTPLKEMIDLPPQQKIAQHGWHLFIIKLIKSKWKIDRNRFIDLMSSKGIECGVHYKPLFEMSGYKNSFGLKAACFPVACDAWQRVVTLPLYPSLNKDKIDFICQAINQISKSNRR